MFIYGWQERGTVAPKKNNFVFLLVSQFQMVIDDAVFKRNLGPKHNIQNETKTNCHFRFCQLNTPCCFGKKKPSPWRIKSKLTIEQGKHFYNTSSWKRKSRKILCIWNIMPGLFGLILPMPMRYKNHFCNSGADPWSGNFHCRMLSRPTCNFCCLNVNQSGRLPTSRLPWHAQGWGHQYLLASMMMMATMTGWLKKITLLSGVLPAAFLWSTVFKNVITTALRAAFKLSVTE